METDIAYWVALFPIIFMIHDFEELIMLQPWLSKNRKELKERFPKIEQFFESRKIFELSTSSFAVAMFHEFLLFSIITFLSLYFENYKWWFSLLIGYSLHLVLHLIQWILFKKYIPMLITSVLTMPYCICAICVFLNTIELSLQELVVWIVVGIFLTAISVFSAFFWALKFEKWKKNNYTIKINKNLW